MSKAGKLPADGVVNLICSGDDLVIEAAAAGDGKTLPRFKMVAYTGVPMGVQGWYEPVVVDLATLKIPKQKRPVRFQHSEYQGVGHTTRIAVEKNRLLAEGEFSRVNDWTQDIIESGRRGFPWQASIGVRVSETDFIRENDSVTVNGRLHKGPLYVTKKAVLGEISFVDLAADPGATARVIGRQTGSNAMDEEKDQIQEDTKGEKDPSASVEAAAESSSVESVSIPVKLTGVEEMRKDLAAELRRVKAIRDACPKQEEIAAKAIEEDWTVEKAELENLRAERATLPAIHMGDAEAPNEGVLKAACLLSGGISKIKNHCDEKSVEAASKRFKHGLGLQELLFEAARVNGYTGRGTRDTRVLLDYAFGRKLQAGFSSIDLAGILADSGNAFLLEGFFSVERAWRDICSVKNVANFLTYTSYRLVGKDQYELVAPGGEIKHGTLEEESYTNKADTYALMLQVSRTDIINDDLGAITTVPRKLGRGSGLKINDIFWTEFMDNATFFAVGYLNYLTGAGSALGVTGLTAAEVAFLDLLDSEGKPIGTMPQMILVPTALSATGQVLYTSLEMRDTTASKKFATGNPHSGKFRVVTSRYLGNADYTGYSATAWYLLADPRDLSTIEVAFLNGQEAPTIERADADFNRLGIQMRGYHDFGVSKQEPRAGVMSVGA